MTTRTRSKAALATRILMVVAAIGLGQALTGCSPPPRYSNVPCGSSSLLADDGQNICDSRCTDAKKALNESETELDSIIASLKKDLAEGANVAEMIRELEQRKTTIGSTFNRALSECKSRTITFYGGHEEARDTAAYNMCSCNVDLASLGVGDTDIGNQWVRNQCDITTLGDTNSPNRPSSCNSGSSAATGDFQRNQIDTTITLNDGEGMVNTAGNPGDAGSSAAIAGAPLPKGPIAKYTPIGKNTGASGSKYGNGSAESGYSTAAVDYSSFGKKAGSKAGGTSAADTTGAQGALSQDSAPDTYKNGGHAGAKAGAGGENPDLASALEALAGGGAAGAGGGKGGNELVFGAQAGAKGPGAGGPGGAAGSRDPASAGGAGSSAMLSEDPSDYFERISKSDSLFYKVERRYGFVAKDWAK